MATQLQIRRGTASQVAAFTGAEGEVVVNTTNDSVHVNDGSTAGGFELARADLNNVSNAGINAAINGSTISALTITTLTLGSTAITATGAEINILDGVTATAAELNILDGVTSTTAELNILDGVTSTTAELNILDGVTSTAAELNILDGVTSTAAELNILDGVTSTAAELNILDGVTATTAELNFVDGVTSGIQAQIDALGSGGAYNSWLIKTSAYTALAGDQIIVNSSSATTITLPASASAGDTIIVKATGGGTVTVGRNSQNINSTASDGTLASDKATQLVFVNSTVGFLEI